MNLFDLRKELAKKYPDKIVKLRFTEGCKKGYDISMIDGKPAMHGHVVYNKVQVEVEGSEPHLVQIQNHRQVVDFPQFKQIMSGFVEAAVGDQLLDSLAQEPSESLDDAISKISSQSGVPSAEIKKRMNARKASKQHDQEIPILVG